MKKFLLSLALLMAISAGAAIKPQSMGVVKEYAPSGQFDPYCRLLYRDDNSYFAFKLGFVGTVDPISFELYLGSSLDEAAASILALNGILKNGAKDEFFILDDETKVQKVSSTEMHVYREGILDYGQLYRPHLNKSLDFLRQRATNNK